MDRNQVKAVMNRELSRFLYRARGLSRKSAAQIASALGISESTLRAIEEKPAEVPCRELYRLFVHYGPKQMHRAQLVLVNAQASLVAARESHGLDVKGAAEQKKKPQSQEIPPSTNSLKRPPEGPSPEH